MFTGMINHSGALIGTILVLTGAATVYGGAATADTNQDDQFLALLDAENIPALENVPSLIASAHRDCRRLDSGVPVAEVVREKVNDAYNVDPGERGYPIDRLARTMTLFVTAAVDAYCPNNRGKIASIAANPALGSSGPAAYTRTAVDWGTGLGEPTSFAAARGWVLAASIGTVPSGDLTMPDPPTPLPSPPADQIRTPHRAIAAQPRPQQPPPPPKQPPPPPKQPPPAPQEPQPPAAGPQPGNAVGGGGGNAGGQAAVAVQVARAVAVRRSRPWGRASSGSRRKNQTAASPGSARGSPVGCASWPPPARLRARRGVGRNHGNPLQPHDRSVA
ncbi:DUF732 domain-containing protein [Mycobacterium bohemicum]